MKHIPLMARCVATAPNLPSAVLLERLFWRQKHTRIKRQDKKWICLTFDQLSQETGLSEHQVKRAIVSLQTAGLIRRYPQQLKWKKQWFTRLSGETISALSEQCASAPFEQGASALSEQCASAPLEKEVLGKEVFQKGVGAVAALPHTPSETGIEKNSEEVEMEKSGAGKGAKILEAKKSDADVKTISLGFAEDQDDLLDPEKLAELVERAVDRDELEEVFRRGWVISGIPRPIRKWGSKEWGQVALIGTWLFQTPEAEGITAAQLLGECCSKWAVFKGYVADKAGWDVKKLSTIPDVGMILYRKEIALRFVLGEEAHAHAPDKHQMKSFKDF